MKQILLLLLSLMTGLMLKAETTAATSYAGGDGTNDNPYQIATLAQLRLLSETTDDWSKSFILTADIDAVDTETWNSGAGFSRIGTSGTKFTGIFDGNNYTIDSLYINNQNEGYGMFGYINGATIKYLGLTNCSVIVDDKGGSLIGYASSSVIEGCYSTGSVTGSGANVMGGLVGVLSSCTMEACYSTCNVTTASGGNNFGGLVGITWGTSTIQDCFATGQVYCGSNYGGITGQLQSGNAVITNCYISGSLNNTNYIITANNEGTITNCYYDQTRNTGTSTNATGIVSSDFSDEAGFSDWDFNAIWYIDSLPNIDTVKRPYLRWQYEHYTLKFTTNSYGTVSGETTQYIFPGEDASTVTAVANAGYDFLEWQDENGNAVSTNISLTLTNINQDTSITAIFIKYGGGSGTSSDPYQIANLTHLQTLSETADDWDKYFIQTANIDASETKNWNISGTDTLGFSPIGNSTNSFSGTFNGNLYTIDSLYINGTSTDSIGLFGYTNGAVIDSIGITNCNISGGGYVGSLAGVAKYSDISNCYSYGEVSGEERAGGLIGLNDTSSTVSYCYSNCNVSSEGNGAGGLTGVVIKSTLSNSYATGKVTTGGATAGGLVAGGNTAAIENCYATGTVSGSSNAIGGLMGSGNTITITNCYATGTVSGSSDIGGLMGLNVSSLTITDSYYDSETTGASKGVGSDSQDSRSLTTAQFSDESNFSGWDFSSIWKVLAIVGVDTVKRPNLQWTYDHAVTFELDENGDSIVGIDIQGVAYDSSALAVTAIPKTGYSFDEWRDAAGDSVTNNNPLTLTNVTQDSTLTAVFDAIQYTLTLETGTNGTISPSGDSTVTIEDTVVCSIIPDEGYIVSKVYLDDNIIPYSGNTYTFSNVDSSHTLKVEFEEFDGVLTLNPERDAYIYYNKNNSERANTNYGEDSSLLLKYESSYTNYWYSLIHFSDIQDILDSMNITNASDTIAGVKLNLYHNPNSSHTGDNAFNVYSYNKDWEETEVTWNNAPSLGSDAAYASVAASTSDTMDYSIDISNLFNSEYQEADGEAGFFLKFTNTSSDKRVALCSKENTSGNFPELEIYIKGFYYPVNFTTSGNGTISGDATQIIRKDSSASTVTAVANTGSYFVEWQDTDGNSVSTETSITITDVSRDSSLTAVFETYTFDLSFSVDANGSLSGETSQTIAYGSNATTITATAITEGYGFVGWLNDAGDTVSTDNSLTVTYVTQDSTLKAIFTEKYEAGTGSNDNPYQIATPEQLRNLSESAGDWTRSFIQTADINASASNTWNISGTDTLGFSPIGNATHQFTGSFNGYSYTVDSIYINRTSSDNVGIFGYINGAVIDSIRLTNSDISGNVAVGCLAGTAYASGITNCSAAGEVTGDERIGGLIGLTDGSSVVSYCNASCNVSASVKTAGGLIGTALSSNLSYCYATGNVSLNGPTAGGLVGGSTSSQVTNCYATGAVTATGNNVGGLGGWIYITSVSKCFALGYVSGEGQYSGGLIGVYKASSMTNCYAAGEVSDSGSSNGGLVGYNNSATIADCYFDTLTCNQSTGIGYDNNSQTVTGLATAQFSDTANFSGWDFDTNWKVLALVSADIVKRPNLQWTYDYVVSFDLGAHGDTLIGADIQGIAKDSSALQITAVANSGYKFLEWQDTSGYVVSSDNPFILTDVASDSTITAVFKKKESSNTSIADINISGISVYPNPTQEVLYLRLYADSDDIVSISIVSTNGAIMYQTEQTLSAGNNQLSVDVSGFSQGMYSIVVGNYSKRFVKE